MSQVTERALCLIVTLYLVVRYNQTRVIVLGSYSLLFFVLFCFFFCPYMKVGFFGYVTYCKVEIKGDILANFSLDFISQLTRLGN